MIEFIVAATWRVSGYRQRAACRAAYQKRELSGSVSRSDQVRPLAPVSQLKQVEQGKLSEHPGEHVPSCKPCGCCTL